MKSGYKCIVSLILAFFFCNHISHSKANESNGLGDHIDWQIWQDGLSLAKETGKPLMLILHKSWCPACKSLKPKFAGSEEIDKLSSQFVMVNAKEGEEPMGDSKLDIDGKYIPRVIFLDSEGNVLSDVINDDGNPQYKYYHMNSESIIKSMRKVLQIAANGKKELADEL